MRKRRRDCTCRIAGYQTYSSDTTNAQTGQQKYGKVVKLGTARADDEDGVLYDELSQLGVRLQWDGFREDASGEWVRKRDFFFGCTGIGYIAQVCMIRMLAHQTISRALN